MPLDEAVRSDIHTYCVRDLDGDIDVHTEKFSFITNENLRKRLGRAFYSARYTYKLMEGLQVKGDELHPFVKFQITQYASIYEAVIVNLLWGHYKEHEEVLKFQTHKAYKPVAAMGSLTKMTYEENELFMCVHRDSRTPRHSIPFRDKVDCAVRIGFISENYSEDLKRTYELRNLAHIEAEAEKQIDVEIEQAKTAYWRMKPFLDDIKRAVSNTQ